MATKKKNDALALWDKEMAEAAAAAVKEVASLGGSQFISTKGGVFRLGDAIIGNTMPVVVVATTFEHCYYDTEYDAESRTPPACYAFGNDLDTIKPHEAVQSPVCDNCKLCDYNQWGSADRGRGKKCRQRIRLAVVSAGDLDRSGRFEALSAEGFSSSPVAMLGIPTTSMGTWAAYVKALAATKNLAPFGAVTQLEVQPNDKTMLSIIPTFLAKVGTPWISAVMSKRKESEALLVAPFPEGEEPKRKPSRRKTSKKKTKRKFK